MLLLADDGTHTSAKPLYKIRAKFKGALLGVKFVPLRKIRLYSPHAKDL